ncbi:hypothetical protein SAMN04488096_101316 [Mesonia phycicola]|uniref:Uncharacterized protein n=1 Tax=Mesonia phycicola TaxID=579105 RepID=A0A1M6AKS0_9FLAO|nr:hypothetical protein [Mesonia phycicola]SHI37031.1 hypothetical protein SAMN04488096_101316 [Mesonia phycicola]
MKYLKIIITVSLLCLLYLIGLGAVSYFNLDLVIIGVFAELLTIPVVLTVLILFGFGLVKFFISKDKKKQFLSISLINVLSIAWMVFMTLAE